MLHLAWEAGVTIIKIIACPQALVWRRTYDLQPSPAGAPLSHLQPLLTPPDSPPFPFLVLPSFVSNGHPSFATNKHSDKLLQVQAHRNAARPARGRNCQENSGDVGGGSWNPSGAGEAPVGSRGPLRAVPRGEGTHVGACPGFWLLVLRLETFFNLSEYFLSFLVRPASVRC